MLNANYNKDACVPEHDKDVGIYVHIPFCLKKCNYCNFFSIIASPSLKNDFIKALLNEIKVSSLYHHCKFDTLYIGGGTPSVLPSYNIEQIVDSFNLHHNFCFNPEITLEINPGTVCLNQLKDYRKAGINRLNIGVQSFEENNLNFLGRIHCKKRAVDTIVNARKAGFINIGIDLIYALPGQTEKSWIIDLQTAVKFEPEHISCYMLTYEKGTKMTQEKNKGVFLPLSESKAGKLFEITTDFLEANGYIWYEISNYAKAESGSSGFNNFKDNKSVHNQKYWSNIPYLGFGPSAHSFVAPVRYWNISCVAKYIDKISAGKMPVAGKEVLSKEQLMMEAVFLGLRKREGINIQLFNKRFDTSFNKKFKEKVTYLVEQGFILCNKNFCELTRKGFLFHDSITLILTDEI